MSKLPHKLAVVLKRLEEHGPVRRENDQWRCHCPAHKDGQPSLYVEQGDSHILLNCKAGCTFEQVIDALDLASSDLRLDAGDLDDVVDDWPSPAEDRGTTSCPSSQVPGPSAAGTEVPRVYQALLDQLSLTEDHRAALIRRGLNDSEIDRRGYKTLDRFASHQAVGRLMGQFTEGQLLAVPGFVQANDRVEVVKLEGLLCPVRNAGGDVVALKVRRDDGAGGPKYLYLSSNGHGGSPAQAAVHVPLGSPTSADLMRVTEGELKADVAFSLSGVPTISVPGIGSYKAALPVLRRMQARTVLVAFDQDDKQPTRDAARALLDALREDGFDPQLEVWDSAGGKHKGVDDLLAAGYTPQILTGEAMYAALSPAPEAPTPGIPGPTGGPAPVPPSGDHSGPGPFPTHVFPKTIRRFCEQVAAATNTPPDFAALGILTVAGAAIGTSRRIVLKNRTWEEYPLLYALAVADPASGKSPALSMVTRPYEKLQHDRLQAYELEASAYEKAREAREQVDLENRSRAGGEPQPLPDLPPRPDRPERLVTTEATTEALQLLLARNPRGLLMYTDEGTAWVRGQGQYKAGRGNDRQMWLSTWSGKALVVDRKANGGNVISVRRPFLPVLGGIQPDMLGELQDARGRQDGFVHRLLFVFPATCPNQGWNEETVDPDLQDAWRQTLLSLRQLQMPADEDDQTGALPLTPEARVLWVDWYNQHWEEIRSGTLPPCLIGPWAKLVSYCARFALIIHLLRVVQGESTETARIDATSTGHAIELSSYFKSHLRAVYGRLETTPEEQRALRALEWVRKKPEGRCTARELQRAGLPGVTKASVAREILDQLVDLGYGRMETPPGNRSGGTFVFDPRC